MAVRRLSVIMVLLLVAAVARADDSSLLIMVPHGYLSLTPPAQTVLMLVFSVNNEELLRITPEGQIIWGKKGPPDQMAREAWGVLMHAFPLVRYEKCVEYLRGVD